MALDFFSAFGPFFGKVHGYKRLLEIKFIKIIGVIQIGLIGSAVDEA